MVLSVNIPLKLPDSDSSPLPEKTDKCRRCVVMGNGGILKGLELGPLINRFDTIIRLATQTQWYDLIITFWVLCHVVVHIITDTSHCTSPNKGSQWLPVSPSFRLNSGPLGEFSVDVGNRTSIRMSYPEGTPRRWIDTDPDTVFVAVVYKSVDISWISAMMKKLTVVSSVNFLFRFCFCSCTILYRSHLGCLHNTVYVNMMQLINHLKIVILWLMEPLHTAVF